MRDLPVTYLQRMLTIFYGPKVRYVVCVIIVAALLQSCTSIYARFSYEFSPSKHNNHVFFEPGAEDLASEIATTLKQHIATIEKKQYQAFKAIGELKVFVFADKNRYANYSNSSPLARGSATTNEIYISPLINERRHTLAAILLHELSHIHIRQYLGTWRYWSEVPGWFLEGLAVQVSGGGGAEKVSEQQAIEMIRAGNYFVPNEQSSIWGHSFAHDYDLKPHVYYRQSNLFVRYIQELDPLAFEKSYKALTQGLEFTKVWQKYYQKSIPELWQEYLAGIQS